MPYSTQANIEARFGAESVAQWADTDRDGRINASAVTTAITDADGEIDSRLTGRFAVPFTGTIPPMIQRISVLLAAWNLYTMRGQQDRAPEENLLRDRDTGFDLLQRLSTGELELRTAAGGRVANRVDIVVYPRADA